MNAINEKLQGILSPRPIYYEAIDNVVLFTADATPSHPLLRIQGRCQLKSKHPLFDQKPLALMTLYTASQGEKKADQSRQARRKDIIASQYFVQDPNIWIHHARVQK